MKSFKDSDFVKSSYSGYGSNSGTNCVQVAIGKKLIAVRDSKDNEKVTLCFSPSEWRAFINGVKAGEFNVP